MMTLNFENLDQLPPRIERPGHDPRAVSPGILHIGLGNFHRAHQALYLHDLMGCGLAMDWGILGAGVMPSDAQMRSDLEAQDWLFTVVEQDAEQETARICAAMTGFVPVAPDHAPMRSAMEDPAIRIVSLTVTEGGYFLDSSGQPDLAHAALQADIRSPDTPATAFGAIVAGLRARRDAGQAPFTVMCCDNLPHNGVITKTLIQAIAEAQDPKLGAWIGENVSFPNAMVDRITPATTEARAAQLRDGFGLQDARPVFCEPFRQWVIEDQFCAGRPPLEQAGAEFVSDVAPFETMKIRILNGGHAVIAYAAGLLGVEFAHEAMAHPLVGRFFDKVEAEEILPNVPPVPGTDRAAYVDLIRRRFANPRVEDTIRRLCLDGSNRQPKFIVPSIRDNLARGGPVAGLALESALWCRYCMGQDENSAEIAPNDPSWGQLQKRAIQAQESPQIWLDMAEVYGELRGSAEFASAFETALQDILSQGVAATLQAYLQS